MKISMTLKLAILVDGLLRVLGLASFTLFIGAVYGLSGKTFDIGLISLATFVPSLFVMLISARLFDKFNARNILIVMTGLRLLTYGLASLFPDTIQVLYLAAAIHSLVHQISMVAKMDIDANLVDDRTRIDYLSMKNLIANVVTVVGPPIGGGLIAWLGAEGSFLSMGFITILLATSLIPLTKIYSTNQAQQILKSADLSATKVSKGFFESLQELKAKPKAFVTVITYCLVAIILEIQAPLIFPFVREVYNRGPEFASYLLGLAGFGGIVGALLPKFYPRIITTSIMPYLLVFDGLIFGIFTVVKSTSIALVLFALLGILGALTLIIVEAVVQIEVDHDSRQQVYSIMQFAGGAGGASVGVIAAYLADLFGTQKILTSAAGVEILCGAAGVLIFAANLQRRKILQ